MEVHHAPVYSNMSSGSKLPFSSSSLSFSSSSTEDRLPEGEAETADAFDAISDVSEGEDGDEGVEEEEEDGLPLWSLVE